MQFWQWFLNPITRVITPEKSWIGTDLPLLWTTGYALEIEPVAQQVVGPDAGSV